jgi:small subunit ribosomal protein S20
MANHKSAIKRTRSNEAKRLRNRYQAKTVRTFLKKETQNEVPTDDLKKLLSSIDKLAKKNIFHKNKAANLKSQLMKRANKARAAAAAPKVAVAEKAPKVAKKVSKSKAK